jgi:hypothetical protein
VVFGITPHDDQIFTFAVTYLKSSEAFVMATQNGQGEFFANSKSAKNIWLKAACVGSMNDAVNWLGESRQDR